MNEEVRSQPKNADQQEELPSVNEELQRLIRNKIQSR
jgi:hypothetical protein